MQPLKFYLAISLIWLTGVCQGQDTTSWFAKADRFSGKLFHSVERKSQRLQNKMDRSMQRYLSGLRNQELRLKSQLAKKDSVTAEQTFGDVEGRYDALDSARTRTDLQNDYQARLDSMSTALQFLKRQASSSQAQQYLQKASGQYQGLQEKFNQSTFIEQQLSQREAELKDKLQNLGLIKEWNKYRGKLYYYKAQMEEYRNVLNNPEKMERVLLSIANRFPAFQSFFAKYSLLGRIFRLPTQEEENPAGIAGLQTRSLILQDMQQQLGATSDVQRYMAGGVSSIQSNFDNLKNQLTQNGSSADMDMPSFKPNNQKVKSFLKRIQLGTNIQSVKSNFFFPTITDIGLSAGYTFTSVIIAGIGASYKMGWGKDIRHLSITHQGAGLRTFVDVKLKGSWWISGGSEWNYRCAFKDFAQLKNMPAWQQSALLGISKKYQVSAKLKGNIQVLYDFLHAHQRPATQPVILRMGYQFK